MYSKVSSSPLKSPNAPCAVSTSRSGNFSLYVDANVPVGQAITMRASSCSVRIATCTAVDLPLPTGPKRTKARQSSSSVKSTHFTSSGRAQLSAKPQLGDRLIEAGVYFQVNWDSFSGHHGRATRKMAIYLASRGYIHCLATDSHDAKIRNALQVQKTAETIEKLIGPRNLRLISRYNPIRLLHNEVLKPMETADIQATVKKKRKWRFWKNGAESNPQI